MTQQSKQCNKEEGYNGKDLDYVEERCTKCGKRMTNVEYIWVDENDRYICTFCKNKHKINAVHCAEMDY